MRGKKFISLTLSTMLCLQLLPTASFAAAPATDTGNAGLIAEGDYAIAGNGVRVTYDADGQTITLYRTEGSGLIQMSKPSPLGGPVVGGQEVQDFSHISCDVEQSTSGVMGSGQRMTITSQSMSTGLIRTYVLETSDIEEGVVYTPMRQELLMWKCLGSLAVCMSFMVRKIVSGAITAAVRGRCTTMIRFKRLT